MKTIVLLAIIGLVTCSCRAEESMKITVLPETVSTGYIGVGVEWDPYDEAESWGATLSDADWQKLFDRMDVMHPGYVRCMINSPYRYYDPVTKQYDKTRNIESISRLLQYCTDRKITVVYGEFNPPTWAMKDSPEWVDMSVDYLNYLVHDLGFDCIKYFIIFNEPDGDWASTDGNYHLWESMLMRFAEKMKEYPGLSNVKFAAPDAVVDYRNQASAFDGAGWIKQAAADADSLIGIYDVHAYPGQAEVRSGNYPDLLKRYKAAVPQGKKIILGEAGYKYWREADSLLMKEYNRRLEEHPYTKGTDSNMLVYDTFYGVDMALLGIETMNSGFSGLAAWMLDDSMHSSGDSGKPEDIKLWGMWNILGEKVFHDATQEEVRPWYYAWSLLSRYFPAGSNILKTDFDRTQGVYVAVAEKNGEYSMAAVNVGNRDKQLDITFPGNWGNATLYLYNEKHPVPAKSGVKVEKTHRMTIPAQSFIILTNMFQKSTIF